MPKCRHLSVLLGVGLALAPIIGCGSPTAADKKPVAPASGSAEPAGVKRVTGKPIRTDSETEEPTRTNLDAEGPTPAKGDSDEPTRAERDADEIVFNFSLTEPLVGRVVATRALKRQGLDALEARIEWPIRIDRTPDGARISSGRPEVSPLRARLPEDALNQLLIGRMFLASGILDSRGVFRAAEGTAESVGALHDSLTTAAGSLRDRGDLRRFLSNALSERTIETTTREHWKTMVQSLVGKSMQVGETYETEAATDMPMGESVVFASTLKVVSQEPCSAEESEPRCVRIESHSQPKGSLLDMVRKSASTYLQEGMSIEGFNIAIDMVQVLNPATLVPRSLRIIKTTKTDVRLPNGVTVAMREVSTEDWQYHWEVRESEEGS
jgi:hypothetical protein